MKSLQECVAEATQEIRHQSLLRPRVALVLGSGLGAVADLVEAELRLSTTDIPNCPKSTVPGHAGMLILGRLSGVPVVVQSGRVHQYEGYRAAEVTFLTRVVRALGAEALVVTNASGVLNPAFRPGEVMVIADHISLPGLAGRSPLVGSAGDGEAPAFVDLTGAYSERLRGWVREAAARENQVVHEGVYVMVGGPNFETPAEVRFLRQIGGDAVGMSTVPEVIVGRKLGMEVLGLSVLSNFAAGMPGAALAHEDVLQAVAAAAPFVARLVEGVVARLG
ncbi:MAG TPA: purine-nucleoside phosphorylase [Chloroflexota bacterium]|nr:purine-nucleoside phosphorylase [Chloroflexota bacterium]